MAYEAPLIGPFRPGEFGPEPAPFLSLSVSGKGYSSGSSSSLLTISDPL